MKISNRIIGKFNKKMHIKSKKRSKTTIISMVIAIVVSMFFTTKASAYYDIDGLIRRANQEVQGFVASFSAQADREIAAHRSNLESRLKQELEGYEKSLAEAANREIRDTRDRMIKESEAKLLKRKKEKLMLELKELELRPTQK